MNVLYPSFESSWFGDRPAPAPSLNERHTDALEALAIKRLIAREGRSLEAHRSTASEHRPLPPIRPQHVEAMAVDPITNGTYKRPSIIPPQPPRRPGPACITTNCWCG